MDTTLRIVITDDGDAKPASTGDVAQSPDVADQLKQDATIQEPATEQRGGLPSMLGSIHQTIREIKDLMGRPGKGTPPVSPETASRPGKDATGIEGEAGQPTQPDPPQADAADAIIQTLGALRGFTSGFIRPLIIAAEQLLSVIRQAGVRNFAQEPPMRNFAQEPPQGRPTPPQPEPAIRPEIGPTVDRPPTPSQPTRRPESSRPDATPPRTRGTGIKPTRTSQAKTKPSKPSVEPPSRPTTRRPIAPAPRQVAGTNRQPITRRAVSGRQPTRPRPSAQAGIGQATLAAARPTPPTTMPAQTTGAGASGSMSGLLSSALAAGPMIGAVMAAKYAVESAIQQWGQTKRVVMAGVAQPLIGAASLDSDAVSESLLQSAEAAGDTAAKFGLLGVAINEHVKTFTEGVRIVKQFNRALEGTAGRLAGYSPAISVAMAQREVAEISGDVRRARFLGNDLARLTNANTRLEQASQDVMAQLAKPLIGPLTVSLEKIANILERTNDMMERNQRVMDAIGRTNEVISEAAFVPIERAMLASEAILVLLRRWFRWEEQRADNQQDDSFPSFEQLLRPAWDLGEQQLMDLILQAGRRGGRGQ